MISIFTGFFAIFNDFGSILGGPGPSKNCPKSKKIAFGTRLECILDFGIDFGMIFRDFGWILPYFGRIWEDKQ